MKLEHVAFNVAFPMEIADWYVEHLKMRIVRKVAGASLTHFLVDESESTIIEIYNNPPEQVPDYAFMDPLLFHLAFTSNDPSADQARLEQVGAVTVEELRFEDGSHLIMMRDPWGLALQLCKRGVPLLETS